MPQACPRSIEGGIAHLPDSRRQGAQAPLPGSAPRLRRDHRHGGRGALGRAVGRRRPCHLPRPGRDRHGERCLRRHRRALAVEGLHLAGPRRDPRERLTTSPCRGCARSRPSSTGIAPPRRLTPCRGTTAIGVDIGGTNLRAARVGRDGTILARLAVPVDRDPAASPAWSRTLRGRLMRRTSGRHRHRRARTHRPFAPARCCPAAMSTSPAWISRAGWKRAFGRPVTLDNDVAMALAGEHAFGAARGCEDVVMITVGTGIGGAVLPAKALAGRRQCRPARASGARSGRPRLRLWPPRLLRGAGRRPGARPADGRIRTA